MTLNEAISHARKVAENNIRDSKYTKISNNKQMNDKYVLGCIECAKEHEQLAEWMEELKEYRTIGTPKECRAAVEKQRPKKWERGIEDDVRCPFCATMTKKTLMSRYCSFCGQRLE